VSGISGVRKMSSAGRMRSQGLPGSAEGSDCAEICLDKRFQPKSPGKPGKLARHDILGHAVKHLDIHIGYTLNALHEAHRLAQKCTLAKLAGIEAESIKQGCAYQLLDALPLIIRQHSYPR
jgi:hypothetical protein